jgi:hypothetical protein
MSKKKQATEPRIYWSNKEKILTIKGQHSCVPASARLQSSHPFINLDGGSSLPRNKSSVLAYPLL